MQSSSLGLRIPRILDSKNSKESYTCFITDTGDENPRKLKPRALIPTVTTQNLTFMSRLWTHGGRQPLSFDLLAC